MSTILTLAGSAGLALLASAEGPGFDVVTPPPAQDEGELVWRWKNGLSFGTRDGRSTFKIGGRIQWDNSWIGGDDDFDAAGLETEDGSEFRAARMFVSGEVHDGWSFKLEVDFAGEVGADDSRPSMKDVFIGYEDLLGTADVKAGHFKEPFSIGELTSSRFVTFVERGLPSAFAPSRNNGVTLSDTALDGNLTWAVGIFRSDSDDAGFDAEDGAYAATARVTGTPLYEEDGETLVHLGLGYSMRSGDDVRFRARPEVHNTNRWVDTGTLDSDGVDLGGAEIGTVLGPFHATAEYMMADVDAMDDPTFDGFYVQAGWFLTGESRTYERSSGTWGRVVPEAPLSADGWGALETAVRWSTLDLDDEGVTGGEEENVSVALNWYPNANTRVMLDYVRADVENGAFDEGTDILALRLQVDW